ncbi:hypothetical protein EON64_05135 [archaeon]|nr:MAG: hypothetical protein EON64_05135 [archaeon]
MSTQGHACACARRTLRGDEHAACAERQQAGARTAYSSCNEMLQPVARSSDVKKASQAGQPASQPLTAAVGSLASARLWDAYGVRREEVSAHIKSKASLLVFQTAKKLMGKA